MRDGRSVLVAVIAALFLHAIGGSAAAQTLDGTVVLAPDSSAVSGVPVELHRVASDSGAVIDSTVSSPQGSFRFALDTVGHPDAVYLTAARYRGLRYFGPALHAGMDLGAPYRIVVFDTALVNGPREDLAIELRHVVITPVPEGALVVGEIVDVAGPAGGRTLVPADSTVEVWRASIPSDAVEASVMEGGLPPEDVALSAAGAGIRTALPPDGARLALQYAVPGHTWRLQLDHPVRRMDVVVVGAAEVTASGGLQAVPASDVNGRPVRRFTAEAVPGGTTVSVDIPPPPGPGRRALPWFVAGGLLLIAAASSTIWSRRRSST